MVLYELPVSKYDRIRPLIQHVIIDRAALESTLAKQNGRVFVDDSTHPTQAIVTTVGNEIFLLGKPTHDSPLRPFIADLPSETGIFSPDYLAYFAPDKQWRDVIEADSTYEMEWFDAYAFRYEKTIAPDFPPNNDIIIQQVTPDIAQAIQDGTYQATENLAEVKYDVVAKHGYGFVAIHGNMIASICEALWLSDSHLSISVDTHPDFRHRGLATQTSSALIAYCLKNNITVLWNSVAHNQASIATARKLGFAEHRIQAESQWQPYRPKKILSTGKWVSSTRNDNVIVWQRLS